MEPEQLFLLLDGELRTTVRGSPKRNDAVP